MAGARCFLGVPVDHHLALELLGQRDRAMKRLAAARPREVEAANFHLTLAFLGDVGAEQIHSLVRELGPLVARHRPFLQPLERAGCFPDARGKRFAVEGEPVPEILALTQALAPVLEQVGLPVEPRRLRPHISFLRLKLPPVPPPGWDVDLVLPVREVVLYESVQGARGSDYRIFDSFLLSNHSRS